MGFSFKKTMSKFNSGAASLVGSVGGLLNGLTGVTEQTDRTYNQQMKAMQVENAYNRNMWDLQNQYNSPVSQLARMRDAGVDINPTSYALGTGNLSNTASTVTSAGGFSGSGSPAGNPISALMGVASGIQSIRESKARTALDDANKKSVVANIDNVEERTRQFKNDNEFFEKHGYYPPHGETPAFSAYDTGPVKEVVTEGWNILKEAHERARRKYVEKHPDYNGW